MNKEINSIMVNCNLSRKEAWILYKSRNPITPYSRVVSQNSTASTTTPAQKPCNCEAQEKLIIQMQQQIKELQQQILSYQLSLPTPGTSHQQTPQSLQNVIPIQIPIDDPLQNAKDFQNRVSRLDQEKQSQSKDRSRSNSNCPRNNMPPPPSKKSKEEKSRKDKEKDKNIQTK
jgi:hypothetical protein